MMVGGIKLWAMVLLSCALIYPSSARMGYDIVASAGGPTFELHRSTGYMSFSLDGSVKGSGNFSRLNSVTDIAGVTAKEATSTTKNGSLNYSEQIRLLSKEGSVLVTANLNSSNFTDQTNGNLVVKASANIDVDEIWPTNFANRKKIAYVGPGIRTSERYENNGDVVATSISSWKLSKQSLYRAYLNRTIISADITSSEVVVDISSNKSSSYALGLQSIGSLTNLDIIKRDSSGAIADRVCQDYRGQQDMTLSVSMNNYVLKPPKDEQWLDCCPGGSMYEKLFSNQ